MSAYMYTEPKKPISNIAVRFKEVPVCGYNLSVSDEKRIYSQREFLRIYQNMALIREFETMLSDLKNSGSYQGIAYTLRDTIPLDIGREAVSVGEAYGLDKNDVIFSAEKNIGDLLAKGLASIAAMSDYEVVDMMRKYHDGAILSAVAQAADANVKPKDIAIDFLLYGVLAEIFSKITGFQYGLGGASHVFFTPLGIYPSDMIPAASAGLAVGAAVYKKNMEHKGFVIANMYENAACDGRAWEAFCLAESGAFRDNKKKNEGLPILFTMTRFRDIGENATVVKRCIARICAGLDANSMHAEAVNGSDPLAVVDAVTRKKERLARGEGPALLELICDDLSVNPGGIDPVKNYREKLIHGGIAKEMDLDALDELIIRRMKKICALAADDEKSPRASADNIEASLYGSEDDIGVPALPNERLLPEVKAPKSECLRLKKISEKLRTAYTLDGKLAAKEYRYNIGDALFESILDAFYTNPKFIACGSQLDDPVYEGLSSMIPGHRFFRINASEHALASLALGYAICGGRSVVALKNSDSLAYISDVLIRQAAKWRSFSGGDLRIPLIVRVPVKSKADAQNADEMLSLAASVPGIKVIYPVTPYDAKGLMTAALKENNPVICFENQKLYDAGEYFERGGVPEAPYALPMAAPDVKREGKDITILAFGSVLYRAAEAAKILEEHYGVQVEILSAGCVVPFDFSPVLQSIEKTGKILIVGDGNERGSVMRDIASGIADFAFDSLDAPPIALGARNWVTPPSVYMNDYQPTVKAILDVIHQRMMPLEGYVPMRDVSAEEKMRRYAKGV